MVLSPRIESVLFDLDGTLIDTHAVILESMQHATQEVLGTVIPPERLMAKVGQPLAVQMKDFTSDPDEQETLVTVYRAYQATIHDDMVRPFEGTETVLAALHDRGYKLGVVTSKLHMPAMRGLGLFGLDAYMTAVVGADDCAEHKPAPAPVIYGASLVGTSPEHCMYVGDSPFDLQAGNAAGCVTVAALWGMFAEDVLRAESPTYECDSIRCLQGLLN